MKKIAFIGWVLLCFYCNLQAQTIYFSKFYDAVANSPEVGVHAFFP